MDQRLRLAERHLAEPLIRRVATIWSEDGAKIGRHISGEVPAVSEGVGQDEWVGSDRDPVDLILPTANHSTGTTSHISHGMHARRT